MNIDCALLIYLQTFCNNKQAFLKETFKRIQVNILRIWLKKQ